MDPKNILITVLSEAVRKLQETTGTEKDEYVAFLRNSFQMHTDEKWLMTKLRMMLIELGANVNKLHILTLKSTSKSTFKNVSSQSGIVSKESKRSQQGYKNRKGPSNSRRARRINLEEKQLNKLRSLKINEKKSTANMESKFQFLKVLNIEQNVICIN